MTRLPFPFLTALAAAYGVALLTRLLLRERSRCNLAVTTVSVVAIAACLLLIPSDRVLVRAFAALVCLDVVLRVTDYARQLRVGTMPLLAGAEYVRWLIPIPFLLPHACRHPPASAAKGKRLVELVRLLVGLGFFAAVVVAAVGTSRVTALRGSFLLDHTVKAAMFVVAVEAGSQWLLALERLAGFDPPPIMDRTYLSRTPAEFWFRWNQRIRLWFYDNVFIPGGGRRRPVVGVVAVFAASAVLHEVAFGIATSRFTGCQATFFLLQVPAVLASPKLQRLATSAGGLGTIAARGLTGLWLLVTSVFFFEGIHRVFPFFYASQPWLP